jgi:putative tRNA adenosine deaminase-associated protein
MASFVAVLSCDRGRWRGQEFPLDECESVTDIADAALDVPGPLRLVLIEEDDEYAAIVRVDDDEPPRVFLSDAHAADSYPLAAVLADELDEVYGADSADEILEDAPLGHDSAPLGDADIVEDLGTPADDLVRLCSSEGTLPIDVLIAVCDKAGCGAAFDDLRA